MLEAEITARPEGNPTRGPKIGRQVKVIQDAIKLAHCISDEGYERRGDEKRKTASKNQPLIQSARKAGIEKIEMHRAIIGHRWGLRTKNKYEVDSPGSGYRVGPKEIGTCMSHWVVWTHLEKMDNPAYFVIEDDASFRPGFKERTIEASRYLPDDWDMLYLGSCCTKNKIKSHLGGDLYRVEFPFCTHAMVIRHKAVKVLLGNMQKAYAPIDLALASDVLPNLKVYTVLPRLVDQLTANLAI